METGSPCMLNTSNNTRPDCGTNHRTGLESYQPASVAIQTTNTLAKNLAEARAKRAPTCQLFKGFLVATYPEGFHSFPLVLEEVHRWLTPKGFLEPFPLESHQTHETRRHAPHAGTVLTAASLVLLTLVVTYGTPGKVARQTTRSIPGTLSLSHLASADEG